MEIHFNIGATPARLVRDAMFGGMKIVTATQSIWLQHPLNPLTHFSFQLSQSWSRTLEGRHVVVTKQRPLLAAGLRHQAYAIQVDGELVASRSGY